MAESKLTACLTAEFLSCSLCLEGFREPVALNCLHTFCSDCLTSYVKSVNVQPGQDLNCPACRVPMTLPENGVDGLKKNHWIKNLAELVKKAKTDSGVCEMCEDRADAVVKCLECSYGLCNACKLAHQRMRIFQDHQLISVEDLKQGKFEEERKAAPVMCQQHRMPRDLYCTAKSCMNTICMKCKLVEHEGHRAIAFEDQVKKVQTELKETLASMKTQESGFGQEVKKGEDMTQKLEASRKTMAAEIQAHVEALQGQIQSAGDALKLRVDKIFQDGKSMTSSLLDGTQKKHNQYLTGCQIIENMLENCTHEDLICLTPSVLEQFLSFQKEKHSAVDWEKWRQPVFKKGTNAKEQISDIVGDVIDNNGPLRPFKVGDKVKVKASVTAPTFGWGDVTHRSIGEVIRWRDDKFDVRFAEHSDWTAIPEEMEHCP